MDAEQSDNIQYASEAFDFRSAQVNERQLNMCPKCSSPSIGHDQWTYKCLDWDYILLDEKINLNPKEESKTILMAENQGDLPN